LSDCVLCQIIDGKLRAKVLYQDDLVLALDLPKDHPVRLAPIHFLVIPKEHVPSAREVDAKHEPALGRLITVARRIAHDMGIEPTGYRLASNTGDDAGQTVFHLHLHCLGGRKLGPEG
jgi:histidine triad (HIT) family protein